MSATTECPEVHELLGRTAWARRLARQLVRREDEADDLLQEAWLVAAARTPRGPVAPRTWLTGVLRVLGMRRARAAGRRRQRESEAVTDAVAASNDRVAPPDELLDQVATQRRLSEELLALAEPYRTTVLLRYYEELSAAEIARRTAVPAGTVRWRLKEGLDRLRRGLDQRAGGRRAWALALARFVAQGPVARNVHRIAAGVGLAASGAGVLCLVAVLTHQSRSSPARSAMAPGESQAAGETTGAHLAPDRGRGARAVAAALTTQAGPGATAAAAREIPASRVARFWVPLGVGPVKGPPTAKVTILAFMDYQSPFCLRGSQTMDEVMAAHAGDVRYQIIHRPLPIHRQAAFATRAALAAGQQGKFWEMHQLLLSNQGALEAGDIDGYARKIGLDMVRFRADIDGPTVINQADLEEANAQSIRVDAVPAFFFNGRPVFGARPRAELERALAEELAHADEVLKAGVEPAALYNTITRTGATEVGPAREAGQGPDSQIVTRNRGQGGQNGGDFPEFQAARKLVSDNTAAVNACYQAERAIKPALAGRVVLEVFIAAGQAPTLSIRESTLNAPGVESCIVRSMQDLVFPGLRPGTRLILRYPFTFPPGSGSERP